MFQPLIRLQAYWVKIVYRVQALPRPQRPGPAGGAPPGATKQGLVLECSNTMEIWWNMNKPTLGLKQNGHRNPPQKNSLSIDSGESRTPEQTRALSYKDPKMVELGFPNFCLTFTLIPEFEQYMKVRNFKDKTFRTTSNSIPQSCSTDSYCFQYSWTRLWNAKIFGLF